MKNPLISSLIIASILLAPALRADDMPPAQPPTEEQTTSPGQQTQTIQPAPEEEATTLPLADQPAAEDEGTSVGQASSEGTRTAKTRMWQNIGLAVGAIAIAVTALILVSNNDGHHHKDHHHNHSHH